MHEVESFIRPVISLCSEHDSVHNSLADAVTDRICERESVRILSSLLDSLIAHTHTHSDDQRDRRVISHSDLLPDLNSISDDQHDGVSTSGLAIGTRLRS